MSAYCSLAAAYDGLTTDIDYAAILDFLEAILHQADRHPETVLDLACGTGSMSIELSKRGFDVTGVDLSDEMLSEAQNKIYECGEKVLFLC